MNKNKAFTLIEVLVSSSILVVALAGVFLVFNFGQTQSPIELNRMDASAQARIIINRITNDLRGAVVWDINNHNPSDSYIKFRKLRESIDYAADTEDDKSYYVFLYNCESYNDGETCFADFVEYFYDEETKKLRRSFITKRIFKNQENQIVEKVIENETSVSFEDIIESPFDISELGSGFILIDIVVGGLGGARAPAPVFLTQKIKIRNE